MKSVKSLLRCFCPKSSVRVDAVQSEVADDILVTDLGNYAAPRRDCFRNTHQEDELIWVLKKFLVEVHDEGNSTRN